MFPSLQNPQSRRAFFLPSLPSSIQHTSSKGRKNGQWIFSELHAIVFFNDADCVCGRSWTKGGLHIMHHFQYSGSHLQATWSKGAGLFFYYWDLAICLVKLASLDLFLFSFVLLGVEQNQCLRESDFRTFWMGRNMAILNWLLYESSSLIICLQVSLAPCCSSLPDFAYETGIPCSTLLIEEIFLFRDFFYE